MIAVKIDKDRFKYDIHSLIKAFYPDEDVSVFTAAEWDERGGFPGGELSFDIKIPEEGTDSLQTEAADGVAGAGAASELSTNGSTESYRTPKNLVKQELYRELVRRTGRTLPWGSLTGIRPTRIPMAMLESGRTREEIEDYLREVFFVSGEKISLATDIAVRERKVLARIPDVAGGVSIYIGIPFCPTRCLYCSFTSYPREAYENRITDYLSCLERELAGAAGMINGRRVDTIYIGGGTPTALTASELDRLLEMTHRYIDTGRLAEFTVEAGRPDSITAEKLTVLNRYGVTRISVNPQTMNDETLVRIGRRHTVADTVKAYELARSVGNYSINMDLILGLPGETEKEVEKTMEEIGRLKPDDLTVHSLAVKRGSRLKEIMADPRMKDIQGQKSGAGDGIQTGSPSTGRFIRDEIKNTSAMMDIAAAGALEMGLKPYYLYRQKNMAGNFENTGYAAEGKEGLYNILIMEELQDIIALGAGTVSKRVFGDGRIERTDSVRDLGQYMDRLDEMIGRKMKLFGDCS